MFGRQFLILSYCKAAVAVVLVAARTFPFLVNDASKDNSLLRDGMVVAFSSEAKTEVVSAVAVMTAFSSAAEMVVVAALFTTSAAAMEVVAAVLAAVMTAFSSAAEMVEEVAALFTTSAAAMEVVAAAPSVTTAFSSAAEMVEVSASATTGVAFFFALMRLDTRVAVVALDLDGGGMMMMK